jgi:hypothetical protein
MIALDTLGHKLIGSGAFGFANSNTPYLFRKQKPLNQHVIDYLIEKDFAWLVVGNGQKQPLKKNGILQQLLPHALVLQMDIALTYRPTMFDETSFALHVGTRPGFASALSKGIADLAIYRAGGDLALSAEGFGQPSLKLVGGDALADDGMCVIYITY